MIQKFLSLIKFSHTIFAMPFAMLGYFMAIRFYGFDWVLLLQIVLAMIFARSAAMGFNRLVDREWDAKNPRTAGREIPSGQLSSGAVGWFVAVCSMLFVVTALTINVLCFALSPVALALILGYSYTKRFTSFAHLVLGLALGLAPIGAYVAVSGSVSWEVMLVCGVVLFWVAGFDIIFALQDEEFDVSESLHSIPARFGTRGALRISAGCHVLSAVAIVLLGFVMVGANEWIYFTGAGLFIAILALEHIMVTPSKKHNIGFAFSTLNSMGSVLYCTTTIFSFYF